MRKRGFCLCRDGTGTNKVTVYAYIRMLRLKERNGSE